MTVKITVVGLGQVGASIGMALAVHKEKITLTGHDPDTSVMKNLEKTGVFEKTIVKLVDAVKDADIVVVALPTDLVKDALSLMAGSLKPDTVIICFAEVVSRLYAWARDLLPPGQPFIVLTPALNPNRLQDWNTDLHRPQPDLFEKSAMLISSDYDTKPNAIQVASEICDLLKARPYFIDPAEADGIIARVALLPKLTAAAMVNLLLTSPGWKDTRQLAAREFTRIAAVSGLHNEQEYLGISSIMNKQNVIRALEEMIYALQDIRSMVDDEDEDTLKATLLEARQGFETWWTQRLSEEWEKQPARDIPVKRDILGRLLGGKPREPKHD